MRDPQLIARLLPLANAFNRLYLRLRVSGTEHLSRDPVLYVSNHNGGIAGPDLSCTLATLWNELGPDAPIYAMAHDFAMRQFTPLGALLSRFGAVRAKPNNAQRILAEGGQVLVYPGGDLDAYRESSRRDEIVFGTRTGFVRVARRANVPIVPIVVHGAHRSAFVLSDGERIARAINLPAWGRLERFPIALALPWGLALGPWVPYLPLPFPVTLAILPPTRIEEGESDDEARERIRGLMQSKLDELAR
jgi:1-acyl-sn-glycerol-3-phosphate acyltransferase